MTSLKVDGDPTPAPGVPPGRRGRRFGLILTAAGVVVLLAALGGAYAILRTPGSQPGPGSATSSAAAPSHANPDYAVRCLAVGAAAPGQPQTEGQARFQEASDEVGPLTIRRSFEASLPATFAASTAGGDPAAGRHSIVSWRPPSNDYRGAAQGAYDRRIQAWARSVPRTGIYATVDHEPEKDMSAADFVALQRHVYTVVKAANPTIHWGPIYTAYWWDPTQPSHYVGNPSAWWPGKEYADFVGLDWYSQNPKPMTTSESFLTWYRLFAPQDLPLLIPEYGQYLVPNGQQADPAKQQERARMIRQDAAWVSRHPQIKAWLYWMGSDPRGSWRLTDRASQQAWRTLAAGGCRP
jgi:hypothetical protein